MVLPLGHVKFLFWLSVTGVDTRLMKENIVCVSESLKNVSLYFYVHFPGNVVCRELTV